MLKKETTEWLFTGAAASLIGLGTWVGTLQADVDNLNIRKVNDSDFARLDQRLEDHEQNFERLGNEVEKIDDKQDQILDILRRVER